MNVDATMADDPTAGFSAIAPYLQHPPVLVGFVLLVVVGLFQAFLRSEKVATESPGGSGRLLLALAALRDGAAKAWLLTAATR
jgi:hypothetical protein